jgi:hypothetical protein
VRISRRISELIVPGWQSNDTGRKIVVDRRAWDSVENRVDVYVWDRVDANVWDRVGACIWARVFDRVLARIGLRVWSRVGAREREAVMR